MQDLSENRTLSMALFAPNKPALSLIKWWYQDLTGGARGKCRRCKRCRFDPWVRKIPWRRKWQTTPVFLPGEPHGQRSLAGYSPWDHKERLSMNAYIFQKFSFCKRRTGNSVFTYFISFLFLPQDIGKIPL